MGASALRQARLASMQQAKPAGSQGMQRSTASQIELTSEEVASRSEEEDDGMSDTATDTATADASTLLATFGEMDSEDVLVEDYTAPMRAPRLVSRKHINEQGTRPDEFSAS